MSEQSLSERVIDALADAVVVGTFDGVVTSWAASAERMFGWTRAEVVGRPLPGVPDEAAAAQYAAALARVATGESVELAGRGRRTDGVVLDLWISFTPMARVQGDRDGWLAIVRDATRERAVQRDLRRRIELVGRLASVIAGLNSDLDLRTLLQRISASGVQLLASDGAAYTLPDRGDLEVVAVWACRRRCSASGSTSPVQPWRPCCGAGAPRWRSTTPTTRTGRVRPSNATTRACPASPWR